MEAVDIQELKRLVELLGDIGRNELAFWMADHAHEFIAEVESLRKQLEEANAQLQLATVGEFAGQAGQAHLSALVDELRTNAERYIALRNVPDHIVGQSGIPCIAIPESATSGDFATGDDADEAVDRVLAQVKERGK